MENWMQKSLKVVLVCGAVLVSSCAQHNAQSVDRASQTMTQSLGCTDMKSLVFDSFYEMIDQDKSVPSAHELKTSLQNEMDKIKATKNLSADSSSVLDQITLELFKVVDLMLAQTPDMTSASWKEQIQKIIEYEMGDQSSAALVQAHSEINQSLARAKQLSTSLDMPCEITYKPGATASTPVPAPAALVPLTQGVKRILATAYQSCRVLDLPAMDATTSDVVGITRLAENHPDGVGGRRVISDLKSVQKTHYYIRGIATESSCVKVADSPLIYDYGGEPSISGTTLNFFKDAGSGTSVLGVDCSAFVSSVIAVSGYRYKPNLANKPIYTRQTSSKFISAESSGFTCFDNVTVTPQKSIAAGDIVGVNGHVVIVDRIGSDPFGLASVKTVSGCASLNYKNFDIDVAQSSPSKNGIGINKYKIKDYLSETQKMQTAFVGMGQQACLAKFQNKSIKPKSSDWGFIRHKGTAECIALRVSLSGESCAQSCF